MKKTFLLMGTLCAALLPVVWFSQGCQGTLPNLPAVVSTPLPQNVISNFSNGSLIMNPTMLNGKNGYFLPETYGGAAGQPNMINGSNNPNILVPNPGNGSAYAIHVYGQQTDPVPTSYPAMEVFAFMKNDQSNPYYDITPPAYGGTFPYTGIRMDIKILPYSTAGGVTVGDNNSQKRFGIACGPMVPPTTALGGNCPPDFSSNCYDYFWACSNTGTIINLPTTNPAVNGGWQPVSFLFATNFKTDTFGNFKNTKIFQNSNNFFSSQVLFLLWKFGDNGAGSTTYTDFWVDNVQFY